VITSGVHEEFTATVKTGDRFYAQRGAILDGEYLVVSAFRVPFGEAADDVEVIGSDPMHPLVVENYGKSHHSQIGSIQTNTRTQLGVIYSNGWRLQSVEVTRSASRGISLSNGMTISQCSIIDNDRLGIGGGGVGITIVHDTVSDNGNAVTQRGWEAGGIKTVGQDVVIEHNSIVGNGAPGIWTDGTAAHVEIDHNSLRRNAGGIRVEISRNIKVANNSVSESGRGGAVIVVSSANVVVTGNKIQNNQGGGILVGGVGRVGPKGVTLRHVRVMHNQIAQSGVSGLHQSPPPGTAITFDWDHYVGGRLQWDGRHVTFAEFRAAGQERHGTWQP
jgi:parallel beta-helix repeat protein